MVGRNSKPGHLARKGRDDRGSWGWKGRTGGGAGGEGSKQNKSQVLVQKLDGHNVKYHMTTVRRWR